jgi:hypothetical protein
MQKHDCGLIINENRCAAHRKYLQKKATENALKVQRTEILFYDYQIIREKY